ncbi:MAG: hypothetical protein ACR2FY_00050 [Pirellulaceae bacterium]
MTVTPKRRWFQFSLRTALVLTAMVACFLGGWKTRDIAAYVPPEPFFIDGIVLGAKEDMYELSVGSDDAVAVGTVFVVSRKGSKLGELVVFDTSPDSCVGMLKESKPYWTARYFWQAAPAVLQSGDAARANISQEQVDQMQSYRKQKFHARINEAMGMGS